MNNRKKIVSNGEKIQVISWLIQNQSTLTNWTLEDIVARIKRELKIDINALTIKRAINEGKLPVKYKTKQGNYPPMAQVFARIKQLEAAYLALCDEVGITPDSNILDLHKSDAQENS